MAQAVNVLALVRDGHKYIFLYDDQSFDTVRAQLARFAEDPELDFNWRDASTLHDRLMNLQESQWNDRAEDFHAFF